MPAQNIGILCVGTFLPPAVRTNDFWPASFRERFSETRKTDITTPDVNAPQAVALVREVLGQYEKDPFRGAKERRVLDLSLDASSMEVEAARQALDRAGLKATDIDVLIVSAVVPDLIGSGNASTVHHQLGLRPEVLTLNMDTQCSSPLSALLTAIPHIASGSAKYALLIQSAAYSRVLPYERPMSVNFGDGASAFILGKVADGRGVLGHSWFNDGSFHRAIAIAPRGKSRWYEPSDGLVAVNPDLSKGAEVPYRLAEIADQAVSTSLNKAGVTKESVDFFASHQTTAWFVELSARGAGLDGAKAPSTFAWTGGVGPANVGLNLEAGVSSGALKPDDVAVLYSTGAGMTWGSVVLRWGT